MAKQEPGGALAELDGSRETAEHELAAARHEGLERLQHDRDTLLKPYVRMAHEALEDLISEERRHLYKLLRLDVCLKGMFAG